MRDFEKPQRSVVVATEAMAATSHPSATLAAVRIMAAGGNAMDAAIAASAVQCVVEPGSTGIGGDCFRAISRAKAPARSSPTMALAAPHPRRARMVRRARPGRDSAAVARMRSRCRARSTHGRRLHADHGKMPFAEVLAPAIRFAEQGYAISPRVHRDWMLETDLLSADPPQAASSCLTDARHVSARCIASRSLAPRCGASGGGRDGFYTGAVADDIVSYLRSLGGVHTLDDFASAAVNMSNPSHRLPAAIGSTSARRTAKASSR